jgi:hypothetical protein
MAEFQRVSALKRWVIGSLVSDTGSEFLFGFDPAQGLMWLERPGHEYSSADPVWNQAEAYIRTSGVAVEDPTYSEREDHQAVLFEAASIQESSGEERPRTVTRSTTSVGIESGLPVSEDPRIVEPLSDAGNMEASDEDIAVQAAQFLANLGEEYDGE